MKNRYDLRAREKLWGFRWVAYPVASLFPKQKREEWIGDMHEVMYQMEKYHKYPRWFTNIMIILKTFVLILSAIEISIKDLLIVVKKINKE